MITVDRSGLVKRNSSGATLAEKEDQKQKEKEKEKEDLPHNTQTKEAHGYVAERHFSCQACLACSLCSPQGSQKRFKPFLFSLKSS